MFEIYRSLTNGRWYWRLKSRNGRIVASGGEGYDGQSRVLRAMANVRRYVRDAKVRVLEE